jgi:hypothetical protein
MIRYKSEGVGMVNTPIPFLPTYPTSKGKIWEIIGMRIL